MDIMSLKDILLVGVPDALVWVFFGILLCFSDYFKDKKLLNITLKLIISVVFILGTVIYIRTLVTNIIYVCLVSALLYMITFRLIWKFNLRTSFFNGFMIVFTSASVENLFTPLFIYISSFSNIFTQSRFILSLPIRITEIIVVYLIYKGQISIGKTILFREDWNIMSLSKKITTILLITFSFTGAMIVGAYTDILIKESVYKLNLIVISLDIKCIFYGIIFLIIGGLLIISRTRQYEEMKEIKQAFNIPKEKMLLNFLRASEPEDFNKYKLIFDKFTNEGGELNE